MKEGFLFLKKKKQKDFHSFQLVARQMPRHELNS